MPHSLLKASIDARERAPLASLLERITDAFFALDTEWRFRFVNAEAERLLQRARSALLDRSVWEAFPEAVGSTFEREYRRAMREQVPVEFVEFFPPLSSWYEVRAYPAPEGLSVFFRDVTTQRATAAALEQSERRLRLAMDAARLGSFEWDIGSGKVHWSVAIERMHGIPEGSFEGTFDAYQRDFHPDDRERVLATVRQALERGGDAHHLCYRIIRPDGEIRWLEAHGQFERDAGGQPIRLMGVCHDVTEREATRAASEFRKYIVELVASNTESALFMLDAHGCATFMNPAAEAMTGFRLDELRGRRLHDVIHHQRPDGSPYPIEACPIDRALPTGQAVRGHIDTFIRKDGTFFPVTCAASPIIDQGVAVGTVVEVRDITLEMQTRDQLRVVTESIPVQVWTAQPHGGLDYVSSRAVEYFGVEESTLLGTGWASRVHPDDVIAAAERWGASLASGEPYETEFRLRRADGTYRWHLARALPLRDARGAVHRWFGSNTDIEEQKSIERQRDRALAEAQAARRNLYQAFEQAPASISVTEGPRHVMTFQNALSRQGSGDRDLTGRPVRESLPELEGQGLFELLDHVYETGDPYVGLEIPIRFDRDRNGTVLEGWVHLVYQPLRDADGVVYGIMSHSVDVTEQVRARKELELRADELGRLASALEQSNRELDQFAYVASHDLKAPLRGISNLTQWIEEDLGDRLTSESREHMRLVKGRVHRMEGLIDGILAYSRAGRQRTPPEMLDIHALVHDVIDLVAVPDTVRLTVAADLPTIRAERVPMQQVFLNLVSNAVKFTSAHRPDPDIRIGWRDRGDSIEFFVGDNGPGIAPELQPRVWGIFQTLQARDKIEGTGIGLSVVQKIVESRGGRVGIDSVEGNGSTFFVVIPKTPRVPSEPSRFGS